MDPDAWTVGNTNSYDRALAEAASGGDPVRKVGRNDPDLTEPYGGGCVFRTPEAAQAFIDAHGHPYSVYGLKLPNGWGQDVDEAREAEEGFCSLLNAAVITGPWRR